MTVRTRILLVLTMLVAVALIAVIDTVRRWHDSLELQMVTSAQGVLLRRNDVFARQFKHEMDTVRLLAASRALVGAGDAALREDLRYWRKVLPNVEDILVLTGSDKAVGPDDEMPVLAMMSKDSLATLRAGEEIKGEPAVSARSGKPVLFIGAPLPRKDGNWTGALIATIRVDSTLGPLLAHLPGADARMILFDGHLRVLNNGFGELSSGLSAPDPVSAPHAAAVAAVLGASSDGRGVLKGRYEIAGEHFSVFASRLDVGWVLAYVQPEAALFADYWHARRLGGLQLLFVLLAAALLVFMLQRLVLKPLQSIAAALAGMSEGSAPAQVQLSGHDEFGSLAASYNRMVAAVMVSEQRLRSIFEAFPHPIVINRLDDGVFLDANPAYLAHLGRERSEVIGRSIFELGAVSDEGVYRPQREALRDTGRIDNILIRSEASGAEARWSVYSARLIEEGGELAALGVLVDVTQLKAAETQLQESRAKFQALFELAPIPLSFSDERGNFSETYWNDAWYRTFGYSREEADGRGGNSFGLWAEPESRGRIIATALAEGQVEDANVTLRRKDGSLRQCQISFHMISAGTHREMVAAYIDLTDVRQTESELRASELKLHAIFNASPVAMMVADMRGGYKILGANKAWLRQFQRSLSDVLGRNGRDLDFWAHEGDRQHVLNALATEGEITGYEAELWRGDGERLLCRFGGRRVVVGDDEMAVVVMEDITEQRTLEVKLRRFAFMVGHANDAMFLLDRDRVIDCNEAALTMFACARESLIDHDPSEFSPPRQPGGEPSRDVAKAMIERAERGEPVRFEWVHCRADGTTFDSEVALGSFTEAGRPVVVGVVRDITERKRSEVAIRELNASLEQRVIERTRDLEAVNADLARALDNLRHAQDELVRTEKLASLGALVAGVAHELNTPIGNAVTSATTLVDEYRQFGRRMEGGLTRSALVTFVETVGEAGQIIDRNLQRAAELIGSFKQLAVDQTSYQRRNFDLHEVVQEVLLAMMPVIRRGPFQLVDEIADGVRMDSYPGPIGQVLMNLINNAAVHAFEGRSAGTIRLKAVRTEPEWVTVIVEDDGRGISPQDQKRIFDPFFTTRLGQGGSGLGLHIAYSLVVELLGGRIDVNSAVGEGSCFMVRLPVVAPLSRSPG